MKIGRGIGLHGRNPERTAAPPPRNGLPSKLDSDSHNEQAGHDNNR